MSKKLGFLVCFSLAFGINELDLEKEFFANADVSAAQNIQKKSLDDDDILKTCDLLAKLKQNDENIDHTKVYELYNNACKNNDYHACYCLGGMYELVDLLGNDLKKAFELYTKACDGQNNLGCKNAMKLQYGIKF